MGSPNIEVANQEQETARLSTIERLIGTLFSPGETFQDINRKPDWILPIIVALILGIAGNFVVIKRINPDWEKIGRDQVEKSLERQGKSLSDLSGQEREAVDSRIKMGAKMGPYFAFVGPVALPIGMALLSLIFWGVVI